MDARLPAHLEVAALLRAVEAAGGFATVIAEGRWVSGRRRVFVAEARLIDCEGDEIGRGTGTFMRSRIALSSLAGYRAP